MLSMVKTGRLGNIQIANNYFFSFFLKREAFTLYIKVVSIL